MTAIAAVTLVTGFANRSFLTFPKGYDAYGHMSKVRFLVDYFPNAGWNSEWYSGQFFSEGSFPPLFHYTAATLVGWFGMSIEAALVAIVAASFAAIACALYGLVRVATGNVFAGAIGALLLLSANAFWSYILLGGLYPRILGMAFLSLFAFFAVLHLKSDSVVAYVGAVLSLAGTLTSHLLLGAIGVALAVVIVAALSRRRLVDGARLLLPPALLAAFFYVPYVVGLARPSPVPVFTRDYAPVSIAALLGGSTLETLSFLLTSVALVVPPVVYFGRQFAVSAVTRRLMPVLAIGGAGSLVYALVGLPLPHLFIYNFQPGQALFFAAWFMAGLTGLAMSAAAVARVPRVIVPLIAVALLGVVAFGPARLSAGVIDADNPAKHELQNALVVDPADRQHRVGVASDAGSDWIDARYDVPQTRGYQQQGVVDADWQYWFESGVWSPAANYDEKNFLLDWYAVKPFYGAPVASRFAQRPDLYAPQNPSGQTFDYVNSSPILAARTTRTALVVGGDAAYRYFVRAIAPSGLDSESVIPVRGGDYLDGNSLAELRQFDLVVLYGYRTHDLASAFRTLNAYVAGGGNVLIEANNSALESSSNAPAPVPGSSVQKGQLVGDWRFSSASSPITSGVQLGGFDPAEYNGGPWGISYIPAASVAPWASPVLFSGGHPVVVAGALGAGHVVWSGMNLPFHAATTMNPEESRLLANEITWAAPKSSVPPAYEAEFVNPQLRRVVVQSSADGVLFKESAVANWQATVNGRTLTIYHAGPDFMYVRLPADISYPATAVFAFNRTAVEWVGDTISAASLVGLAVWLVVRRLRKRNRGLDRA